MAISKGNMLTFKVPKFGKLSSVDLNGVFPLTFKGVSVRLLHRLLSRGRAFRVILINLAIKVNVHLLSVY